MSNIKSFDRVNLKALRLSLDAALADVSKQYGIKVTAGKCSFNAELATFKVEAATIGEGGEAVTRAARDFTEYAKLGLLNGLKPEHLNQPFSTGRDTYTLVGYRPKAGVRPFLGRRADGKEFIFTEQQVLRSLGISRVVERTPLTPVYTPVTPTGVVRGAASVADIIGNPVV